MPASLDVVLQVPAHVVHQTIGEELVFLNLETQRYLSLNPSGARMWRLLGECPSASSVLQRLEQEYQVEPARLSSDLLELLNRLETAGLATFLPMPPPA
ncbi:MAG: PqqD family protein [Gemmatimonadota bacterium]